jgi:hypothetical protein
MLSTRVADTDLSDLSDLPSDNLREMTQHRSGMFEFSRTDKNAYPLGYLPALDLHDLNRS